MEAVVADGLTEGHQSLWKINQKGISPANATLAPLAYLLPGTILERLLILLSIAVPVMKNLRQTSPIAQQPRRILHLSEVEPSVGGLQL